MLLLRVRKVFCLQERRRRRAPKFEKEKILIFGGRRGSTGRRSNWRVYRNVVLFNLYFNKVRGVGWKAEEPPT